MVLKETKYWSPEKVFGCIAYAHIPDNKQQKLDKKSEKLRFVGYCKESKGYRLLDKTNSQVVIRHDVIFNETDFGLREVTKSKYIVEVNTDSNEEKDEQLKKRNNNNRMKISVVWNARGDHL